MRDAQEAVGRLARSLDPKAGFLELIVKRRALSPDGARRLEEQAPDRMTRFLADHDVEGQATMLWGVPIVAPEGMNPLFVLLRETSVNRSNR